MHILLVEDDPKIAHFIKRGFVEQGNEVDIAYDGMTGKAMILGGSYDLVILDIILPYLNGIDLCRQVRPERPDLPILMVTALSNVKDRVEGLSAGADDYLVKPFHFAELSARANALHRRGSQPVGHSVCRVSDLEVDLYKRTVSRSGRSILLTGTEFSLLRLLILHKDTVVSRDYISRSVWGDHIDEDTNVVSVYINYLRGKIDKGFAVPLIHTIINGGYMIKEP